MTDSLTIALAQLNPTVGDIAGNVARIRAARSRAAEQGADYVAFGAFYHSTTKPPKNKAEPEILQWWSEMMTVPSVAIGGITIENCAPLVSAGANFLAVVSGVWDYPEGPAAAVKAFNKAIATIA